MQYFVRFATRGNQASCLAVRRHCMARQAGRQAGAAGRPAVWLQRICLTSNHAAIHAWLAGRLTGSWLAVAGRLRVAAYVCFFDINLQPARSWTSLPRTQILQLAVALLVRVLLLLASLVSDARSQPLPGAMHIILLRLNFFLNALNYVFSQI